MPQSDPTPFGQYQLIEKIAQGGMAEIFRGKALDAEGIERLVVIKRILPHIAASPEFVDMLVDEAKIAVMLSHGNIAQIYDLGKVADDYFIVMEYVEGKTLSQIMKRLRTQGKLIPVAYAAYLCLEIANALDYMHRKTDDRGHPLNIVHRDISPQNVILSTAGNVKIIDFGIAKAKTKVSTTDSGVLKGKFAYMSPEHAEGMRLDHRTDIFSLGIILFELLTGQRLFKGKNNLETIRKVKKSKVPPPSGIRSMIPKALDKIVAKALWKDREKRYLSAHDLSHDLTKFLVTYYPEFSPRELVSYLPTLFPEIAPAEKGRDETTPHVPLEIRQTSERAAPQEGDEHLTVRETHEDTVAADSEVLRTKLKETEVFEVSGAERLEEEEEESPIAPDLEEHTSRIRLTPFLRIAVGIVSLALLATAVWFGVRHITNKRQTKQQVQKVREEQLSKVLRRQNLLKLPTSPPAPPPPPAPPEPPPVAPLAVPASPPPPPPPPAPVGSGSLTIDSTPRGARIFLGDADSNQKTPHFFNELPAGTRKIGLHLDRYRFWEETVEINPGQTTRIAAPLTLNYGDLEINSLPPGAAVMINGQAAGKTPFRLTKLEPDTVYEVILQLEGYQPWKGVAKVFGGKNEVINASLKKTSPTDALPE